MNQLYQKRGRDFRKFELQAEELSIEMKTAGQYQAYKAKYEEIEFNEIISGTRPSTFETALFISVIINLICLTIIFGKNLSSETIGTIFMGFLSGLSLWAYNSFQFKNEKILKGAQNIFFYYTKKDVDAVDAFIEEIKKRQKLYIREKYMKIDDLLPLDNLENIFQWLYNRKFIERNELEVLIEELNNKKLIRER